MIKFLDLPSFYLIRHPIQFQNYHWQLPEIDDTLYAREPPGIPRRVYHKYKRSVLQKTEYFHH